MCHDYRTIFFLLMANDEDYYREFFIKLVKRVGELEKKCSLEGDKFLIRTETYPKGQIKMDKEDLESAFRAYKSLVECRAIFNVVREEIENGNDVLEMFDRMIGRYERIFYQKFE